MRNRRHLGVALAGMAIFAALAILVAPIPFLRGKPVHLSLDDFSAAFADLSATRSESAYGHPTFRWLKSMHDATGAKFTLYTYARAGEWKIGDVPPNIWNELAEGGWIKVGFHAARPESKNEDSAELREAFADFEKAVPRELQAKALRLHYWHASSGDVLFLRTKGAHTLFTADNDVASYSLPPEANDSLRTVQCLFRDSLIYERTDFRTEQSFFAIFAVWSHLRDDWLVIFTHEWALNRWNAVMFWILVLYLALYGCIFIAE